MERIGIVASKSYDVLIGDDLLRKIGKLLAKFNKGRNVAVISDDITSRLFGEKVRISLEDTGYRVFEFSFKNGEASKNIGTYVEILEFLAESGITREDCIIALGGGVVGDIAGFVASSYLRGIAFVQIPTTLLAAVDSSVGGKTAINLRAGKNLAGAFYQPSLVLCDTDIIANLPDEIFSDGMAEVIKYGAIGSERILELCRLGARENLSELIALCVSMKSDIVMKDEFDKGERQLLNLGHTPAHAIEKLSGYEISHGRAVAIGMVLMARAAEKSGLCEQGVSAELSALCEKYSLPVICPFDAEDMAEVAMSDKKRGARGITLVFPEKRGKSILFKAGYYETKKYFTLGIQEKRVTVDIRPFSPAGEIRVIPSKSVAHRYLICASLSDTPCDIVCDASSKDIEATVRCLNDLGAEITESDGVYHVVPISTPRDAMLNCGESGSTLRFLIPVAAALGKNVTFTGEGRLPVRPCSPLTDCLIKSGAEIEYDGTLPLTTHGGMRNGRFEIAGNISSQFITGLILALPLLPGNSEIEITGKIESLPYIKITLDAVRRFGIDVAFSKNVIKIAGGQKYRAPERLTVEGDWSNAAFWTCLGALSGKGITVSGVKASSMQGDREVVNLLRDFGADVILGMDFVTVKRRELRAIRIDASEIPDLVPVLSVVAAVSEGETVIYNASRLRLKESDRIKSTVEMLKSLGAEVYETEEGLRIVGRKRLFGGEVNSYNDHRIAMSAAVAAAVSDGEVTINGAEAVEKSYGDFFDRYKELGANVREER